MILDTLEWLGHAGFRLRAGKAVVYIDPYRVGPGPKADVILITHGHYDHFSPRDIERLSHEHTALVGPPDVAERSSGHVRSITPGETLEPELARGLEVTAVAAYNTSKHDRDGRPFHPPAARWVGYCLNVAGERLYHAGDTDVIPEMDAVGGVDVALLPVCGEYVMTSAEAAEAARRIEPRVAVPTHWGSHLGTRADALDFAARAAVPVRIFDGSSGYTSQSKATLRRSAQ